MLLSLMDADPEDSSNLLGTWDEIDSNCSTTYFPLLAT